MCGYLMVGSATIATGKKSNALVSACCLPSPSETKTAKPYAGRCLPTLPRRTNSCDACSSTDEDLATRRVSDWFGLQPKTIFGGFTVKRLFSLCRSGLAICDELCSGSTDLSSRHCLSFARHKAP